MNNRQIKYEVVIEKKAQRVLLVSRCPIMRGVDVPNMRPTNLSRISSRSAISCRAIDNDDSRVHGLPPRTQGTGGQKPSAHFQDERACKSRYAAR